MFRALQFPNFRWFLLSQACAMTGTWMQQVALGWLVFEMTGSAFHLGLVGAAATIPSFALSPIAGVMADRFDRRRIVVTIQVFAAIHSLVLALLVAGGRATVEMLIGLSLLLGVAQAFDWPTRQSLVVHLVEGRTHLGNAIALNSTIFNLARIGGPSFAGLLLGLDRGAWCFGFAALASGLALAAMTRIRMSTTTAPRAGGAWGREFRAGAGYAWREPAIRRSLALVALASGCIMPYAALLPLFAAEVLAGDARLYGLLAAAPAVGAVTGGLLLARRASSAGLPRQIRAMGAIAPVSVAMFAVSRFLPLTLAALIVLGGAMMVWMSSINTRLQSTVVERMRGRVMSFFVMALMGALPCGYLVMGALAEHAGPTVAVLTGAALCLAGNFWLHRVARAERPALLSGEPA